jgi:hypothetical protein
MSKVSRESAPDVTDYGPAEDRGAHFDGCAEASITTTANTGKRNGHLVAAGSRRSPRRTAELRTTKRMVICGR